MKTNEQREYNGWRNRSTWSVALWIGSDEGLYRAAVEFMAHYRARQPYKDFVRYLGMGRKRTPDGVAWLSAALSYRELNSMMREFRPKGQ